MTVQELADKGIFSLASEGGEMDRQIQAVFCCDLLSVAMGRAPAGCAWVTVMANMNTLAVASLADAACVVMAEGAKLDEAALNKAKLQGICVMETEEPVFEAALKIHDYMKNSPAVRQDI